MFSGIIVGMGSVTENNQHTHRLTISSDIFKERSPALGASIAVNGVCLTAVAIQQNNISFDLGEETRKLTQLSHLKNSDKVNLEFSLRVGDDISGHFVQGHVDGLIKLSVRKEMGDNLILSFDFDPALRPLLVKKGSVAINGVSLTINEISHQSFSVCLLPYTLEQTNLSGLAIAQRAHIEVDILGRYIANFMPPNLQQGSIHDCDSTRFFS